MNWKRFLRPLVAPILTATFVVILPGAAVGGWPSYRLLTLGIVVFACIVGGLLVEAVRSYRERRQK